MDGHERVQASRYARINQSSAERPGSVTANADVAGNLSRFAPNRQVTQRTSQRALWTAHRSCELRAGLLTLYSLGSTGSLSSARTPNTHSCNERKSTRLNS